LQNRKVMVMAGLKIFTGNRLELLSQNLAKNINYDSDSPFQANLILVQSSGMERWLNLQLAKINGISANIDFFFPRTFIMQKLIFSVLSLEQNQHIFNKDVLVWRIVKLLPKLANEAEFWEVKRYISGNNRGMRIYQFARKLAELYDQYITYRPDMLSNWDSFTFCSEPTEAWQRRLWQELNNDEHIFHYAGLVEEFKKRMLQNGEFLLQQADIPKRISLFGFSSLPPAQLELFYFLANYIEVDFYYFNPCQELWEHCYSKKQVLKFREVGMDDDDFYWDAGNPLLASWGRLGREFFSCFLGLDYNDVIDCFVPSTMNGLLGMVQNDILQMRDGKDEQGNKRLIVEDELSVQVHSCHSPMREIEVLYDNLLCLFATKKIKPRNIVVLAPDIQAYAPYIRAVFASPENANLQIPYTIADGVFAIENSYAKGLLMLLRCLQGRFVARDVLDLLENRVIYEKFSLREEDFELLRYWIDEVKICWGVDGKFRGEFSLPELEENSWLFGLERLLLGYALPYHKGKGLFAGRMPFAIEGNDVLVLGYFIDFAKKLFALAKQLNAHKEGLRLAEWEKFLSLSLTQFFRDDEYGDDQLQQTWQGVNLFCKNLEDANYGGRIKLDVILAELEVCFSATAGHYGFLQGGVTFCRFLPMRSIPADVIYMVGMNENVFPRKNRWTSFDLISKKRRLCDRSPRNDDCYLFLEALLSARKMLYISYQGQCIRDNSTLPPSILVSELLDYINSSFVLSAGDINSKLFTKHFLQAYNTQYFSKDSKLFSYSYENYLAAKIVATGENGAGDAKTFISEPLLGIDKKSDLSLQDLLQFFTAPQKYFLRNSLHLNLWMESLQPLATSEVFDINAGLAEYGIMQELLELFVVDGLDVDWFSKFNAEGRLPLGNWGKEIYYSKATEVKTFAKYVLQICEGAKSSNIDNITIDFPEFKITIYAEFRNIYPCGQLFFRWSGLKAKDRLKAWISHLLLNMAGFAYSTTLIYDKKNPRTIVFHPIPIHIAKQILQKLFFLYQDGLQYPLLFFPESSFASANKYLQLQKKQEGLSKQQLIEKAIEASETVWVGFGDVPGEGEQPAIRLCFDNEFPANNEETRELFMTTALTIYQDMLIHEGAMLYE